MKEKWIMGDSRGGKSSPGYLHRLPVYKIIENGKPVDIYEACQFCANAEVYYNPLTRGYVLECPKGKITMFSPRGLVERGRGCDKFINQHRPVKGLPLNFMR